MSYTTKPRTVSRRSRQDKSGQFKYLEVDDDNKHEGGGQQVGAVGEILTVESLPQSSALVRLGDQQVEQSNDCTLEVDAAVDGDGGRAESLPDDVLADVGGNEQGDTRAQAVALLQKLVQDDDDDTSEEQLDDDENGIAGTELTHLTVHAREDIGNGLTNGDDDTEHCKRLNTSTLRDVSDKLGQWYG